jgi:small-conductance mechanosensitive channel
VSGQATGDRLGPDDGRVPAQHGAGADEAREREQEGAAIVAAATATAAPAATATATATGVRDVPGTSPGVVGGAATVAASERAVAAQAGVKQATEQRSGRVHQLEPDEHSPLIALTSAISANFRRALLATVLACLGLGLSYAAGGVLTNSPARVDFFNRHGSIGHAVALGGAVLFLIFGVIAVRSATGEILKTVPSSLGDNRKAGLRWVCLLVGYLFVIFGTLGALNVPIERLLLGGAVTGVILGIAAQQSLGSVFAGLMLLLTRPFAIGDEISIRSGALGGVLTGLVADMNLTYVKLVTDNGTVLLPNAAILSAVVGPPGVFG